MNSPKDPNLESLPLTMDFLRKSYPMVLNLWSVTKKETELHLKYISKWVNHLLREVENVISFMITKFPSLAPYEDSKTREPYYVTNNIIEGLYKEIEHIALTGDEIGLFHLNASIDAIGNGFLFVKSSNRELLVQFMASFSQLLHNENLISEFRNAEIKKAEIESKVLDFKQELHNIIAKLP
jgi:hypothetical protein